MKSLEQIQKELAMPIPSSQLQLRVGNGFKKTDYGFLLIYKDARADVRRLNDVVGCFGWKREHTFKDGKNFCTVSLYDAERNMWVSKEDCGTESNTEKEKGESSDSFKRACFQWGIGLQLYDMPKIGISIDEKDRYGVSGWRIDCAYFKEGNQPAMLKITDNKGIERFKWVHEDATKDNIYVY